ncbi:MAG: hypothetical protein HYR85_28000 [Planctomycetes bacterium]|nr:hypothetical protein [Planctomycetota bacterium]
MNAGIPFLTAYDPPGTSEGTLDPMGLYQIADSLGTVLVPGVRERMQRVRFLTAITIGSIVTEDLRDGQPQRDAAPYLVWEWLVIEALMRAMSDDPSIWGVPGTLVARRAIGERGYLDARSYLKIPRIFGFNGVYKRLAIHLGLVDVHLAPGPSAQRLVDAWARDRGLGSAEGARPTLLRWTAAVKRSLDEKPPRTKPNWNSQAWAELAAAFAPEGFRAREKRCLRELLLAADERRLVALPILWELQAKFDEDDFREETLHDRLEKREPAYGALLNAIRAYEAFARSLHDAFELLRAEAARPDSQGFAVAEIAHVADFRRCVTGLHERFAAAHRALGEFNLARVSLQNLFDGRFGNFGEHMDAGASALELCAHHERIQRGKSADGKRPWFDRLGADRIYIRHAYRDDRRPIEPGHYVHDYRGKPIRRFWYDLT